MAGAVEGPGLGRFVTAQARVWPAPLDELRAGAKRTHWMWFVFPQLRGLGTSRMAQVYGIADLDEARDYLSHPLLGARLGDCARAVLSHADRPAEEILGPVDALKLRSSATLFEAACAPWAEAVLERFFSGSRCPFTTLAVQ